MKQHYTIISIIFLFLFPCCNPHKEKKTSSNPQSQKFECELFSVSIPSGYYYAEESKGNDFHKLIIGKDSLDADKTTIMWESSNIFPGSAEQFVGVITAEEIEDYDSIENEYIKVAYPECTVIRYLSIFGGNLTNIPNEKVLFYLSNDGTICLPSNLPMSIQDRTFMEFCAV